MVVLAHADALLAGYEISDLNSPSKFFLFHVRKNFIGLTARLSRDPFKTALIVEFMQLLCTVLYLSDWQS